MVAKYDSIGIITMDERGIIKSLNLATAPVSE